MDNKLDVIEKLENLQDVIENTASLLDCCYDSMKSQYTDLLSDQIYFIVADINRLNEEVKNGHITKDMASININYWMDESIWTPAKKLFDANNYPEEASAHQRLREAMISLQTSLGLLHHNLQQAPAECYRGFLDTCHDICANGRVEFDYEHHMGTYIYAGDVLQCLRYYLQRVVYGLFERHFLRFDGCTMQCQQDHRFEFDFNLLSSKEKESEETNLFCLCLNRYLTMPDKYTVLLNKERAGKYLYDHFTELTDDDLYSISYFEEALNKYNQGIKEGGFLDVEPKDDTETYILRQPAAMVLWGKLQNAGYINEKLKPTGKASRTQLAIVVELFCDSLNLKTTWKPFEVLWDMKNLRTYYSKITFTDNFDDFRKNMKELLAA